MLCGGQDRIVDNSRLVCGRGSLVSAKLFCATDSWECTYQESQLGGNHKLGSYSIVLVIELLVRSFASV